MDKIIIYDREQNDHICRWLNGLITYLQNKNYQIELCYRNKYPNLNNCKLLLIWNGTEEIHQPLITNAKRNEVPILYIECGFFPQSKYYYIDEKGINAESSLMDDNLEWVKQEHIDKLNEFRKEYLGVRTYTGENEYILCPLQLSTDSNILKHAPFQDMQDFIYHCENKFSNKRILFKTHPILANLNYKVGPNNSLIKSGSFLDWAQNAELVYGQTSTALLESTLMNVPTEAIGHCWLRYHKGKEEKLLAALIDKQIPVGQTDLDYWIEKYVS